MLCYGIWIRAPLRGVLHPLLKQQISAMSSRRGHTSGILPMISNRIHKCSFLCSFCSSRAGIDLPAGYCKRSNENVTMPGSVEALQAGLSFVWQFSENSSIGHSCGMRSMTVQGMSVAAIRFRNKDWSEHVRATPRKLCRWHGNEYPSRPRRAFLLGSTGSVQTRQTICKCSMQFSS